MPSPVKSAVVHTRRFNKRLVNSVFKVVVVVLPAMALYYELNRKSDLHEIGNIFIEQWHGASEWWIISVLLLLPFNWLAEVQKWRPLVNRSAPMSQWTALKAVLAGTSFALFTPNRIGEYGGRLLFVRPENHWEAFLANVAGSFGQYLVILTGGVAGGIWFAGIQFGWSGQVQFQATALGLFVVAVLYYFYFNIGLIVPLARKLPLLSRFANKLRIVPILKGYSRKDLSAIWLWSLLRYVIYSTQYFLLLQFFGIKTGIFAGYAGIATIFLLQTVVPLPAVAGLLVRGNLALFIWSHFSPNDIGILAATFVLWIINLILPALFGTFSLTNVNIAKTLGYEDD